MKNRVVIFSLFLFTNIFSQTGVLPQFSELKGIENKNGNTYLFYRLYEDTTWGEDYFLLKNDIYKFDLSTGVDSLLFTDRAGWDENGTDFHHVDDYDFWNSDVNKYIFGGTSGDFYPYTYIKRFDYLGSLFYQWRGGVDNISISKQDDSLIYVGCSANDLAGQNPFRTVKSTDGGYNWQIVSDSLEFIEVMPDDDQTFFCFNNNYYTYHYDGRLYKTTDGGNNFFLVDTLKDEWDTNDEEIRFDKNHDYVYRIFNSLHFGYIFSVSSQRGNLYTWETKFSSSSKFYVSIDDSVSGTIYLANGKQILYSTDYGNSFNLFRTLERNIVGIYKKPNSDILYAATKYNIYEINSDTILVIKSLPIPENILSLYPLATGNKWIFNEYGYSYDPFSKSALRITTREVLQDTVAPNGKQYYLLKDETRFGGYFLERVDSLEGKVYRYDESLNSSGYEYVTDDLLAEVGDTVSSFRMGYGKGIFTIVLDKTTFNKWNLKKSKLVFVNYSFIHPPVYSLTQDIGLDSVYYYYDFGEGWVILKGCIINGIVYGDTTVVSVDDTKPSVVNSFGLEQNYPNPFNPTTKISWQSPVGSWQTLKVYDILGNEISTIVNEYKPAGEYEVEFDATDLPSGVYFYQLKAGNFIKTNKMILLK
ncbi:T9SS type A sorting domain-containing protein [bacterium BMS3Abin03]|nr:T9SS type A sorting domain-containing protein [bacterium BMS3Abin03]